MSVTVYQINQSNFLEEPKLHQHSYVELFFPINTKLAVYRLYSQN